MPLTIEGCAPLLQVFDMPRALGFYRDVLGFVVVQQNAPGDDCDWCLLRLDQTELMLNTAYEKPDRPTAPDPARTAAHQDTGLYFGCREVDAAYTALRAGGLTVDPPRVAPYGMKQLWLRDPDGYTLCFQWPVG